MDLSAFFDCPDQADVCLELRSYVEEGGADTDHNSNRPPRADDSEFHQPEELHVPLLQDAPQNPPPHHVVHLQAMATATALKGNGSTRLMLHAILLSAGSPYFKACLSTAWNQPQSADGRTLLVEYVEEEELEAAKEVLRFLYTGTLGVWRAGAARGLTTEETCLLLLRMARLAVKFQMQHCVEQCLQALQQLPGSCWGLPAISLLLGLPEGLMLQGGPSETAIRSTALNQLLQLFTPRPWILGAEEIRQFCSLPRAAVVAWVSGISQTPPGAGACDFKDDGEAHVLELVSAWAAGQQGSNEDLLPELMAGMNKARGGDKVVADTWSGSGPSWIRSLHLLQLNAKLHIVTTCTALIAWPGRNPGDAALCALYAALLLVLLLFRGGVCSQLTGSHISGSAAAASSLVCSPGAASLLLYTALSPILFITAATALVAVFVLAVAVHVVSFVLFLIVSIIILTVWFLSVVVLFPLITVLQLLGVVVNGNFWSWGGDMVDDLGQWLITVFFPYWLPPPTLHTP